MGYDVGHKIEVTLAITRKSWFGRMAETDY